MIAARLCRQESREGYKMKDRRKGPFFDGTYWEYCVRFAQDCFHIFPDGAVDVDCDLLNKKIGMFFRKGIGPEWRAEQISLEAVSVILKNILPCDIWAEYTIRLEDAELERLRAYRLVLEEAPDEFDSFVRRPYYRMRGRPVTKEQAFEVIRRTDAYLYGYMWRTKSCHADGLVSSCHFTNWWFDPHHFPAYYGWAHPSGIIGINGITGKYPTMIELLEELLGYQKVFPFLNFAAAITDWDENPYYECRGGKRQENEVQAQYPDFLDHVRCGIRLDGNTIEFLGKERAVKTYQKYETFYCDHDFGVFVPELCWSKEISRGFDKKAYFQRCIEAFGSE